MLYRGDLNGLLGSAGLAHRIAGACGGRCALGARYFYLVPNVLTQLRGIASKTVAGAGLVGQRVVPIRAAKAAFDPISTCIRLAHARVT